MLLSCCFGEQQNTKNKKRREKEKTFLQEKKDSPPPSTALTVHSATFKCSNGQDRKLFQERHPPSKEEKRLLKQRSKDSLYGKSIVSESLPSQRSSIIIPDQNFQEHPSSSDLSKISENHHKSVMLPSPPATPKNKAEHEQKYSIPEPEGSSLSASNRLESARTSSISLITNQSCYKDQYGLILTSTPADAGVGISTASTTFYDLDLPEEKWRKEQVVTVKLFEESMANQLKEEHDHIIKELTDKHQSKMDKIADEYSFKLDNEMKMMKKDNEEAMLQLESEANYNISSMHHQFVQERDIMNIKQQENTRNLELQFEIKENNVNESFKLIEEREQDWKDEKADVIKEVQQLKAEATRMVNILAMEYDEVNLSEDKKRSLSQEVYSLQLVIEMRTGEVRNLREQLNRATQQLEDTDVTKEKLSKATARMEDLEEQIKRKNQFERQTSLEKSQLEMTIINSNKVAERMSHNVEELQWRIDHNFDLPVEILPSAKCQLQRPSSFTGFSKPLVMNLNNPEVDQNKQSTPIPEEKARTHFKKSSFHMVSPEMLEATSYDDTVIETYEDIGDTSDYSPGYDAFVINIIEENYTEEEEEDYFNDLACDNIDCNSLDEGLGDTSSDENAESPVPKGRNLEEQKIDDNIVCDTAMESSANTLATSVPQRCIFDQSQFSLKKEQERRPSRISLETPL